MRPAALVLAVALALGATACSNEPPPPPDDGSQAVPLAGLGGRVEAAGFEVVDADAPVTAAADDVVGALDAAGVTGATTAPGSAAIDALPVGSAAGLLAVVGPPDPADAAAPSPLVLVFTSPSAAAVYAASDPRFDAGSVPEVELVELVSGNLVAFAFSGSDAQRVRDALESLASLTPVSVSPSASPSASPSQD